MTRPLLELTDVTVRFGGLTAVDCVSLTVDEGELVGLIGPNGAGKTTLLRTIVGLVAPQGGRIALGDRDLTHLPIHARARLGLALSQQLVRPFRGMTVVDNVAFAAGKDRTSNPLSALLATSRRAERQQARELLRLVDIEAAAESLPSTQPLGVLKRTEVARALALAPRLLLLDEPLAGLNHVEAGRLADTIADLNTRGVTVLLIEHNLREVLRVCRRLHVLDQGRLIASGEPEAVVARPDVRAAYTGTAAEEGTGGAAA